MAIVHEGANSAKYKIEQYVQQYIDEQTELNQKYYQESLDERPREVRRCWITVAVCAVVLLVLILNPGIVNTCKVAVKDGLDRFAEWLVGFDIFFGAEKGGILGFLMDIVLLVVYLVMRTIVGTVIHLLASVAKFLTAVLMYALPVVVAGFCLFNISGGAPMGPMAPPTRADVMDNLPEELEIDRVGMEGEELALWAIKNKLDNSFHIYTNLRVPYDGEKSETDMIVVGLNGVTIIEVKNYKHSITGDLSDKELVQQHTSHGQTHRKTFYNPVKQVGTHVYRTANYLRRVCKGVQVNCCVFFVNPKCSVSLTDRTGVGAKCPVFVGNDPRLIPYILAGSGCHFSDDDYKNVLWELEKLV